MPLLDNGDGSTTTVDPATVNAGNIRVRVVRPQDIAAAKVNPATTGGPTLDGGNADAITELSLDPASTEATYRALIVKLGVQSAVATRNLDIQAVITGQVDASRESVSGVSIDEEMTTMLSFQHAYSAAARLVTAVDEMLDTLINRTGLVGR